jgi:anti-sigma regulatory factor (Ser/Thr protein kinase)
MATEPPAFSQPSETGQVASVTQQHVSSSGYDPQLSNVASARAWAAAELRDHNQVEDRLVDDVELVLSELMTNAIQAGATRVSIELHAHPDWVLVSVEDDAGGQVTIRPGSPTAAGGRGLPIVAALSTQWGVEARSRGKRVWASMAADAS